MAAGHMPRLAILCLPGLDAHIGSIATGLASRYEVRLVLTDDLAEMTAVVTWADVVWIEWANEMAVAATQNCAGLEDKRVICRVHAYEAFTRHLHNIRWELVDDVIFVAAHIREMVASTIHDFDQRVGRVHIIPTAVDDSEYAFEERPRGKNVAFICSMEQEHGPRLILHAFQALCDVDSDYKLFIAGAFDDRRSPLSFEHTIRSMGLEERVTLDGQVDDVSSWLADKHFIVSTSVLQGHPIGIMEGMACGLKPAIYEFSGARAAYPETYLWRSFAELVENITSSEYTPREYRDFIEQQYTVSQQTEHIFAVLDAPAGKGVAATPARASSITGRAATPPPRAGSGGDEPDGFLEYLKVGRMLRNPHLEHVKERLRALIPKRASVLDLGCGIGLTTEFIHSLGIRDLIGAEISSKLIEFAKRSVPDIEFVNRDITSLDLERTFDVITLADVVEHVPRERYDKLFQVLERHAHDETRVWISVPNPRWLDFVRTHRPDRLQMIDNSIELADIDQLARGAGFKVSAFTSYGIEVPQQYDEYILVRAESGAREAAYRKVFGLHAGDTTT